MKNLKLVTLILSMTFELGVCFKKRASNYFKSLWKDGSKWNLERLRSLKGHMEKFLLIFISGLEKRFIKILKNLKPKNHNERIWER